MSKNTTISIRIDSETKVQSQKVLKQLHMTMSEAVAVFLKQVALQRGIPFEIRIPTELTARSLEKSEKGADVKSFDSVDALFEDLNK